MVKSIRVTRKSMISGIERSRELPITAEQIEAYLSGAVLVQDAFPQLSDADREFIKSGITAEEWQDEFGDEFDDQIGTDDREGGSDE